MISKLRQLNWKSRKIAVGAVLVAVVALFVWVVLSYLLRDRKAGGSPECMFRLFDTPTYS